MIEGRVGRGGMADVWLGRHPLSGQAAAIKVITRDRADDVRFVEGFRREVRAVAGLDHPGIVPVLDAGTITPAVAVASDGALIAGSPWLAMVYAEHGDLRRLGRPLTWPVVRAALLQILDALAHAHARDVIHRDLKPGNVLLQIEGDDLRLMLTDFGIAHLVEGAEGAARAEVNHSSGTPDYMAPEQLRGHWRDFGPWTDLYALGCMTFELLTGAPPYTGATPLQLATRHLSGPIPRLQPASPLPSGITDWVRRLMARSPWDRFASAADAAYALSRLSTPSAAAERRARQQVVQRLTPNPAPQAADASAATVLEPSAVGVEQPIGQAPTLAAVFVAHAASQASVIEDTADVLPSRPPLPETWYRPGRPRPLLRGVGLGLFGVRAQPLVGRDGARNALWDALRRVHARGQAELVQIAGAEGVGKTALADWFVRRAVELGAAGLIRFRFSAMDVAGEALGAGLAGWLQAYGLSGEALVDRVRGALTRRSPARARLIQDVVAPSVSRIIEADADDVALSAGQRYTAYRHCLAVGAADRPLIAVFDDLQWGEEALGYLRWQLEAGLDAPVLIVATVRTDECGIGPDRRRLISRLEALTRCARIEVGPLDDEAHAEAIEELVGLSSRLSRAVRARCQGHPLLATQVITEWVEADQLVPTRAGYDMRPGVEVEVPGDLQTLALRRVGRLLTTLGEAERGLRALELAATLGHAVDAEEWQAACAAAGTALPAGLEAALYDAGLAAPGRGGWVFSYGYVRSALIALTRATSRDRAAHLACARAVHRGRVAAERRAGHLIGAEAFGEAIDALLAAAQIRMDASDYAAALALTDRRVALMDRLDVPANDIRRALDRKLRIDALRYMQRADEARAEYAVFSAMPIAPTHRGLLALRAHTAALMLPIEATTHQMFSAYLEASEMYRAAGDRQGEARTLHGMGWNRIALGQCDKAFDLMRRSRDVARSAGLRIDEGWALHGMSSALFYRHQPGAAPYLEAAHAAFSERRFPIGMGMTRLDRGHHAYVAGDLDAARAHAEDALGILDELDSFQHLLARAVLVILDLHAGRDAQAYAFAAPQIDEAATSTLPRFFLRGLIAACTWAAARAADDARFGAGMTVLEADQGRTSLHPSMRFALVRLAEELDATSRRADARRVWRLIADHWRVVDPARAAELAARAQG